MCVIYSCFGKVPSERELHQGAQDNPDGGGMAWLHKGQVRYRKAMSVEEVIKQTKKIEPPLIIHFRAASQGGKSPLLTHPFPITADVPLAIEGFAPQVMFHNGTWGNWKNELKDIVLRSKRNLRLPEGPWSDSRAIAWIYHHFGKGLLELLLDHGKFVWMRGDGSFAYEGAWYDVETKKGYFQSSETGRRNQLPAHYQPGQDWRANLGQASPKVQLPDPTPTTRTILIAGQGDITNIQLSKVMEQVSMELESLVSGGASCS